MTFDFADIFKLVLWMFFGALALALLMAMGLGKTATARLGGALLVLALFGSITALAYYKFIAEPRQFAAEEAQRKGVPTVDQYKERYAKAKALFDERCKTAGEKIYRTVEDVDGVLLLNLRADDRVANEANPDWPDAGLPNEAGGLEYIANFLKWEQHQDKRNPRGYLNNARSELPGYQYVDVKNEDGAINRYTLSDPGNQDSDKLSKMTLKGKPARYAVAFVNVMNPTDRAMWVAGTTVTIIDTQNDEVIATSTWYALEPGQGSRAGFRQPWRFAQTCPGLRGSAARSPTRFFVDQNLKPKKGS
jgi:hypothetical protein